MVVVEEATVVVGVITVVVGDTTVVVGDTTLVVGVGGHAGGQCFHREGYSFCCCGGHSCGRSFSLLWGIFLSYVGDICFVLWDIFFVVIVGDIVSLLCVCVCVWGGGGGGGGGGGVLSSLWEVLQTWIL